MRVIWAAALKTMMRSPGHAPHRIPAQLRRIDFPSIALNQEIARGYSAPDVRDGLLREGNDVVRNTAERFDVFFRKDMEKWAKVIRAADLVVN